ncbi:MAG TPA: bifunctional 5,10-methylenetetrahydrofolate dehydrogenase/5,10-methenyltetrahydrofolate cyclohydrolase [Candidatus Angelobacter sp.]|nr:bifunctional 5,10-methylenetetrahydrofolate dehydrogenase/5,10-methenyltetrahydrofolate cyclohydrolase [Candidatus Angelobacter sp.]
MATILDGNKIAAQIRTEVAEQVRALAAAGYRPGLGVILAGEDHASEIYVRSKIKACQEVGIHSEKITAPASVTTQELLAEIDRLNQREDIDGILVQLPLPPQVDSAQVLLAVDPEKDVDGFHPVNVGKLATQRPTLAPCTPAGVMQILLRNNIAIAGRHAVVVGRSQVVGRPMALLLLNHDATVTICHSKTVGLPEITRQADILIVAVGRAGLVTESWVKPGATVIDVGINRVTDRTKFEELFAGDAVREKAFAEKGSVVAGDVHPCVAEVAGAITPVPGGVGPLTIAMLMDNTVRACRMRRGRR